MPKTTAAPHERRAARTPRNKQMDFVTPNSKQFTESKSFPCALSTLAFDVLDFEFQDEAVKHALIRDIGTGAKSEPFAAHMEMVEAAR
ncbi:hypothetical protein FQP90_03030 [Paenarthrobacter nitroguajacolicus]|uniref:Uncharacterized protein n=1 Tax=Paenarthrobacter nitroguajacolicus TaxID=211146 RepID=A0A558HB55_PAENT|nr:hypothetical protein [Paenarthrobacter nitroguajacolicus]TVU66360.1 hypothetical protein FQP90_03030 [Paenarthrobacter nitroguajacolicus]